MSIQDALAGKVALITGASRGIGFAIARRLGQMGARVAICGRDQAKLDQSAFSLREEGIETLAVPADVSRADQISSLVQRTQQELGPIDILVNNAGTGLFGPFHEFSEADWDKVLDTNLKSVFLAMPRRRAGDDPPPDGPHHQHQLARWKKHVRQRRNLLRVEMGPYGPVRQHGRGFARAWHSSERHLPRLGGHGIPRPGREKNFENSSAGRHRARRGGPRNAIRRKLHQRSAYPPHAQAVTPSARPKLFCLHCGPLCSSVSSVLKPWHFERSHP